MTNPKQFVPDIQVRVYLDTLDPDVLPEWVWKLSRTQCRKLLECSVYYTSSEVFANDVQRLSLHAGWAATIEVNGHIHVVRIMKGKECFPNTGGAKEECVYYYEGPVYCLQVSSEVFMVRRNGKAVWTGNSRGNHGPIIMLTRQPAEGRARNGGLRFGEMERDAIVAHGASAFLKERMLDVSDNFRVFVCRKCGLLCTGNPEKNIFRCSQCKNGTDIVQVRIPYAMKLLVQELMSLSVAPRLSV